jgi:hypothetical protein
MNRSEDSHRSLVLDSTDIGTRVCRPGNSPHLYARCYLFLRSPGEMPRSARTSSYGIPCLGIPSGHFRRAPNRSPRGWSASYPNSHAKKTLSRYPPRSAANVDHRRSTISTHATGSSERPNPYSRARAKPRRDESRFASHLPLPIGPGEHAARSAVGGERKAGRPPGSDPETVKLRRPLRLIVGLGDSQTFSPQRIELVGSIVYREASRLSMPNPFFAPTILDGGVAKFTTGETAMWFARGFLRAANTEKALVAARASGGIPVQELIYLAGAKHAQDTVDGLAKGYAARD